MRRRSNSVTLPCPCKDLKDVALSLSVNVSPLLLSLILIYYNIEFTRDGAAHSLFNHIMRVEF